MDYNDLELLSIIPEKDRLPIKHFVEQLRARGKSYENIILAGIMRRDTYYYLKGLFVYQCLEMTVRVASKSGQEVPEDQLVQLAESSRRFILGMDHNRVQKAKEDVLFSFLEKTPFLIQLRFHDFLAKMKELEDARK
jgi:hypothetical protein